MNASNVLGLLHFLSIFAFMVGLGAVLSPLLRAWRSDDVQAQALAFEEAHDNEGHLLLGFVLTGATGLFWGAERGYNFLTTGWMVALEVVYLFVLLFCLPLLSLGLRRVHLLSLAAVKEGRVTPELERALADRVSLVFGGIIVLTVPLMAYLAVFRPF